MEKIEKKIDVFGSFYKLRACNVSVVASGVSFMWANQFVAQRLSGEARGAQNLCIFVKRKKKYYSKRVGVFFDVSCTILF